MSEIRTSCNLSDGDFEARRAELRAGLLPQARGREALPNGLALLFDATPELRQELSLYLKSDCDLEYDPDRQVEGSRYQVDGAGLGEAVDALGYRAKADIPLGRNLYLY